MRTIILGILWEVNEESIEMVEESGVAIYQTETHSILSEKNTNIKKAVFNLDEFIVAIESNIKLVDSEGKKYDTTLVKFSNDNEFVVLGSFETIMSIIFYPQQPVIQYCSPN